MSDARTMALAMLESRAADATLCPSEVARAMAEASAQADWRSEMPAVHAAIDAMIADRLVRLSWRGAPLTSREGPYRIARVRP